MTDPNTEVYQRVIHALQMYAENGRELPRLVHEILTDILNLSGCSKALVACRSTLQDDQLRVMEIIDATPLAFPHYAVKSTFVWDAQHKSPTQEAHESYHNILSFPLTFKGHLCGVIMLANSGGLDNDALKIRLEPLVPITAANIIGGSLAHREVVNAHEMFLSTISHEIRTPLSGVIGMSRLLQGGTSLTKEEKDYVDIIHRCGFQLLEIINDILDYTKMDTGRVKLDEVPFSVRETIEAAFDVVFLKAHEKHLELVADVHTEVPEYLIGDRKRIRQVLINLLSNAIKFTSQGRVKCHVFIEREWLIVDIEDTGVGIPATEFHCIFQSFYQLKTSVLDMNEGMGLGLSLCKKIIELMKGEIHVKYSKMSQGTCMSFKIPCVLASTLDENTWAELSLLTENKTLIILDTQEQRRHDLMAIMFKMRAKVLVGSTIAEAILFVKNAQPDIVFIEPLLAEDAKIHSLLQNCPATVLLGVPGPRNMATISQTEVGTLLNTLLKPSKLSRQISTDPTSTSGTVAAVAPHLNLAILVVEDNECNLKVALESLYRLGFPRQKVHAANNGLVAVQMCQQNVYDIIFMDLKMPIMDGYNATKLILEQYRRDKKHTPAIIAMTAFVMNEERQKCKDAGMKGFLPKPLILNELEVMLEVIRKKKHHPPQSKTP
jgi:signal transduction histidine kinase/ActR/RegA family two-component response regulator